MIVVISFVMLLLPVSIFNTLKTSNKLIKKQIRNNLSLTELKCQKKYSGWNHVFFYFAYVHMNSCMLCGFLPTSYICQIFNAFLQWSEKVNLLMSMKIHMDRVFQRWWRKSLIVFHLIRNNKKNECSIQIYCSLATICIRDYLTHHSNKSNVRTHTMNRNNKIE